MPVNDIRNVYKEVSDRLVIRTEDVYQTQTENGTAGYSPTLLAVVAGFRNSGIPEGCNARGMAGKSKRGEVACQLFGTIEPERRMIERIGFRSRGCIAMTACASRICTMAQGKTIADALAITADDLAVSLDGVPSDKRDTPIFATEALHALIGDFLLAEGGLAGLAAEAPCNDSSIPCIMCEHCSLRDLRIDALISPSDSDFEA
jgi:NifU-like protein